MATPCKPGERVPGAGSDSAGVRGAAGLPGGADPARLVRACASSRFVCTTASKLPLRAWAMASPCCRSSPSFASRANCSHHLLYSSSWRCNVLCALRHSRAIDEDDDDERLRPPRRCLRPPRSRSPRPSRPARFPYHGRLLAPLPLLRHEPLPLLFPLLLPAPRWPDRSTRPGVRGVLGRSLPRPPCPDDIARTPRRKRRLAALRAG